MTVLVMGAIGYIGGRLVPELSPMTFISRLVALVPYPRDHVLTYQGVLAPAATG